MWGYAIIHLPSAKAQWLQNELLIMVSIYVNSIHNKTKIDWISAFLYLYLLYYHTKLPNRNRNEIGWILHHFCLLI